MKITLKEATTRLQVPVTRLYNWRFRLGMTQRSTPVYVSTEDYVRLVRHQRRLQMSARALQHEQTQRTTVPLRQFAHCGVWQPLTLPFICQTCQAQYLV